MSHPCDVVHLGVTRYGDALRRQELAHADVVAGKSSGIIFCVEHEPVLTLGKNSDAGNLLFPREFYLKSGVEIFETERGGQVTAHMPGQLVVYPVIDMAGFGLTVREYVSLLEDAVIKTLGGYGIRAHRDAEHPGVWVGHEKICALGVRVKSRVTMHGLALNIHNDLSLFGKIIPCGIKFRGVTSMERIAGRKIPLSDVQGNLVGQIIESLSSRLRDHHAGTPGHD
jgi:lipoyl(octanoyl) transferase